MDEEKIIPIQAPIRADRQGARRHYGVHPYFTRRPYNVVREYIQNYSKERDRVLDPFGGSGVTAIEAFLENRVGIQNDINPLANFIARGIVQLHKGDIVDYDAALRTLREMCQKKLDKLSSISETQLNGTLKKCLFLPSNVELPKTADVHHYHELFSTRQLIALSTLRQAIETLRNPPARSAMLLAWSATLAKLNRTFLSAHGRAESRGGSSIFSIYRYKIAKDPVELPPWKTFEERAQNVIAAKQELDRTIEMRRATTGWHGRFETHTLDAIELAKRFRGKIDYIFTDPPYGGHISYLDLSVLWNNWLNLMPAETAREQELIVGGELDISEHTYSQRLGESIRSCVLMLKPCGWLSVVFQHWNPVYFSAILTAAAENGADLRAAIPQVGDTVWSMHKKKGNESVLAGEMILTFHKLRAAKPLQRTACDFDIRDAISETLASVKSHTLYGEGLFNRLMIAAWKKGAIASLNISKDEFNDIIRQHGWEYDSKNHYWTRGPQEAPLFAANL